MKKVVIFGATGHTGKYITRKMQLIAHLLLFHDFTDEGHNRPHLRVLSAIGRKDILFPYYLRRAGCFLHRNHAGRLTRLYPLCARRQRGRLCAGRKRHGGRRHQANRCHGKSLPDGLRSVKLEIIEPIRPLCGVHALQSGHFSPAAKYFTEHLHRKAPILYCGVMGFML